MYSVIISYFWMEGERDLVFVSYGYDMVFHSRKNMYRWICFGNIGGADEIHLHISYPLYRSCGNETS